MHTHNAACLSQKDSVFLGSVMYSDLFISCVDNVTGFLQLIII